ncbi:MAG TPA: alpha/beta hydrolase [Candidatus Binataceae bacterium]|nr:alpha/beta hydrolase [Candidatus Binataceae bacterium]
MMDRSAELEMLRKALAIAKLKPAAVTLPEDRQIIIGNMRFHYLDWGGSGHPILFLHGGGLTAHTWDVMAVNLCGRFHCIALDQRGHGDSEWSPTIDYGVETQAKDVEGFIAALELEQPVLVGQSMGGLNSIAYASRHSDKVKALVIVDVGPEINPSGTQKIREYASTPEQPSPAAFLERAVKFNPLRDPAVLQRSLYYNLRELPNGNWSLKHDQRRSSDEANRRATAQRERLAPEVVKISCPTLIIRGAKSEVLTDQAADRFARSLPKARWVRIENAGHNVQGDNPAALLDAMLPFLRESGLP